MFEDLDTPDTSVWNDHQRTKEHLLHCYKALIGEDVCIATELSSINEEFGKWFI